MITWKNGRPYVLNLQYVRCIVQLAKHAYYGNIADLGFIVKSSMQYQTENKHFKAITAHFLVHKWQPWEWEVLQLLMTLKYELLSCIKAASHFLNEALRPHSKKKFWFLNLLSHSKYTIIETLRNLAFYFLHVNY